MGNSSYGNSNIEKDFTDSEIAANWKWPGMKHPFKLISNVNAKQFVMTSEKESEN